MAFDNLSGIKPWFSDALCRISTGGGYSDRQLYTDSDQVIIEVMRPIILNGIDSLSNRNDLLARSLVINLPRIDARQRKPKAMLMANYESARPEILGGLLDAVSCALRNMSQVKLDEIPRMADFAIWVSASEDALPWDNGKFLETYREHLEESIDESLEADAVAMAIMEIAEEGEWRGTITELFQEFENKVSDPELKRYGWPKTWRGLSNRLNRVAPLLAAKGIQVERPPRTATRRLIIIKKES